MGDFGFDDRLVLDSQKAFGQQMNDDARTLAQVGLQKAQTSQLQYNQQRQRTLADIASKNPGTYSDPTAQALSNGGYVDEAEKAQQAAEHRAMMVDQLGKFHGDILRSQAATKQTPDDWDKWLSTIPEQVQIAQGIPGQYEPQAVQRYIASGLPPEKQAEYLDAQRRRTQLQDPNSPLNQFKTGLVQQFGGQVPKGLNTGDITDNEMSYLERLAGIKALAASRENVAETRATTPRVGKPGDLDKQLKPIVDDLDPFKGRAGAFGKDGQVLQAADKLNRLTDNGANMNLNPQQMTELSTAVAGLISGGSSAAQSQIEHLTPKTLKGDAAGIAQWVTGNPQGADQQAFVKMMMDTAAREATGANDRIKQVQLRRLAAHAGVFANSPDAAMGVARQYLPDLSDEELGAAFQGKYKQRAGGSGSGGGGGLKPGEVLMYSPDGQPHGVPSANVKEAQDKYKFTMAPPNG